MSTGSATEHMGMNSQGRRLYRQQQFCGKPENTSHPKRSTDTQLEESGSQRDRHKAARSSDF